MLLTKTKIIFVFDFDQTLTMKHSNGTPSLDNDYMEGKLPQLVEMLQELNRIGVIVYVNTMGIGKYVKTYLKDRLGSQFTHLIRQVYGGVQDVEVDQDTGEELIVIDFPPDHNLPSMLSRTDSQFRKKYFPELVGHKISQTTDFEWLRNNTDPFDLWYLQKVSVLEKIQKKERVSKDHIYFFDDTRNYVEVAKIFGFSNSFYVSKKNLPHTIEIVENLIPSIQALKKADIQRFILDQQVALLTQQQKEIVIDAIKNYHESIPSAKSKIDRLRNKGKNRNLKSLQYLVNALARQQKQMKTFDKQQQSKQQQSKQQQSKQQQSKQQQSKQQQQNV